MAKQDLYALLGVEQGATSAELEAAYQKSCAALNDGPDPHSADPLNRLKFLRFARETLLHEGRRKAYDASLLKAEAPPPPPPAPAKQRPAPVPKPLLLAAIGTVVVAAGVLLYLKLAARQPPAPAVVAAPVQAEQAPVDPAARLSTEELFERHSQSVVVIVGLNGESKPIHQGSGVVVADQRVITNCHVAKAAAATTVELGGKSYRASLQRVDPDPEHDLCLLAVAGLHAPAVTLAPVSSLKVGKKVFALGAPKGLDLTLSEGIVSSLRKHDDSHFIQTTASISPGSSGGGLFIDTGELVGITTFQRADGQNLNFAVPVDWVAKLMASKESLAALGPEALSDLLGKWQCDSNKDKERIHYRFKRDGVFSMARPEWKGSEIQGSYAIMGNHTLVLKSGETDPPEVYLQIMALNTHDLRISSPFFEDEQTYQCRKTET